MQQQELVAGDSLNFLTAGGAYPSSSGWVLTYRLVPRTAGASVITLTGTVEGDDHRFAIAAATTAAWVAGDYTWISRVEKAGEKYTLETGQLVVKPNPENLAVGYDGRSLARKTLDDLYAAKAAWDASSGRTRRYKIGEREMEFNSEADLLQKTFFWENKVAAEDTAARLAKGLKPRNRILTRFVRPS